MFQARAGQQSLDKQKILLQGASGQKTMTRSDKQKTPLWRAGRPRLRSQLLVYSQDSLGIHSQEGCGNSVGGYPRGTAETYRRPRPLDVSPNPPTAGNQTVWTRRRKTEDTRTGKRSPFLLHCPSSDLLLTKL